MCALLFASSKNISTQFQHRGQRQAHLQTAEIMNTRDHGGLRQYSPIHHCVEESNVETGMWSQNKEDELNVTTRFKGEAVLQQGQLGGRADCNPSVASVKHVCSVHGSAMSHGLQGQSTYQVSCLPFPSHILL